MRVIVVLLAVWGVIAVIGLATGLIPPASRDAADVTETEAEPEEGAVAAASHPGATDMAAAARAPNARTPRRAPVAPQAYRGCADANAASVVIAQLVGSAAPEVIHGCGEAFEVLAMRPGAFALDRIVRIEGRADEPGTHAVAARAAVADVTADGLPDLVLPFHHRAAGDALPGGQLILVPRLENGSFGEALGLGHVAVGGLAVGALDRTRGSDVGFTHAPDGRSAEVWVISGGAAPGRTGLFPLEGRPRAVAVGDVNGDGQSDLCVVRVGADLPEVQVTWGDGASGFGRTASARVPGATSALVADLDGDSNAELLVVGERLVSVEAAPGSTALRVTPIEPEVALSELKVADVDGDGHIDILGLNAGRAIWLKQIAPGRFETRPFLTVEGATVRRWDVGDLDDDATLDVVALVAGVAGGEQILLVPDPLHRASVKAVAAPAAFAEAPLSLVIQAY